MIIKDVGIMDTGAAYEEIKDYFRQRDPQHKKEDEFFNNLGLYRYSKYGTLDKG